ncbi:hypothetical protein NUW54_g2485 [Trametes sanguinea]|uniref:Uncharacterized protein n=1 Tax=Trametes sanguinea TaxID=158606 RepID=A0ACC1Q534_9APHY|nr:hypothetical protein NUW54_g2485 [Trametes sanguinea]
MLICARLASPPRLILEHALVRERRSRLDSGRDDGSHITLPGCLLSPAAGTCYSNLNRTLELRDETPRTISRAPSTGIGSSAPCAPTSILRTYLRGGDSGERLLEGSKQLQRASIRSIAAGGWVPKAVRRSR